MKLELNLKPLDALRTAANAPRRDRSTASIIIAVAIAFSALFQLTPATPVLAQQATGPVKTADAWARKPLVNGGASAAYLRITNITDKPFRLIGASAKDIERVELHAHIHDKGVMRMRKIEDGVALDPGKEVSFEPGGLHIMLIGVKTRLQTGERIKLVLEFDNGLQKRVELTVKGPPGAAGRKKKSRARRGSH